MFHLIYDGQPVTATCPYCGNPVGVSTIDGMHRVCYDQLMQEMDEAFDDECFEDEEIESY